MNMSFRAIVLVLLVGLLLFVASACLWDEETLAAEKSRFPGIEEILLGVFPRHSREFHLWREKRCRAALTADPSQIALYDDLAVSLHKLGDHDGAITVMLSKEKLRPGLYETYSNLGTFHIYKNQLPQAIEWIDKALEINSNAHFGRERYQKWLVEWTMAGKPNAEVALGEGSINPFGFSRFVFEKSGIVSVSGANESRLPALQGILGMMRFADYDNPLLLEAAGDVLLCGEFESNAAHLACMAYWQAFQNTADPAEKIRLSGKCKQAQNTIDGFVAKTFQSNLAKGLARGKALNEKVRADELAWISENKDASAEFSEKYLKP